MIAPGGRGKVPRRFVSRSKRHFGIASATRAPEKYTSGSPQEAAQKPHFHMARKYLILRV